MVEVGNGGRTHVLAATCVEVGKSFPINDCFSHIGDHQPIFLPLGTFTGTFGSGKLPNYAGAKQGEKIEIEGSSAPDQ